LRITRNSYSHIARALVILKLEEIAGEYRILVKGPLTAKKI
jgi:hypothetical protein